MRISDWSSDVCSSDLFPRPRSMAMHNPRFPRIHPLALSLLLACGAGASLPAMAGITCIVEDSETGTQDNGGADTGTENDSTTACGKGGVAGLVATALGTNQEEIGNASCGDRVCRYG